jgi:hypothetical protein
MKIKEKSVAVMQPYLFPYLGYFQLVNAVDEFVFYDDVNFIKQGWINRNQILDQNSKALLFTVPLEKASSYVTIEATKINSALYGKWKNKFLKTFNQNYRNAPNFTIVNDLVVEVFDELADGSIGTLASKSIMRISQYLGIDTNFRNSSNEFKGLKELEKDQRLYEICNELKATDYINAIGGQNLYNKSDFKDNGTRLHFLKPNLAAYPQFGSDFVSGLSMIDVIMFNSKDECRMLLENYRLL